MKKLAFAISSVLSLIGVLCCFQASAQWYPGFGSWLNTQNAITGNYTALYTDCGNTLSLGGGASYTLTINAASTYSAQCVFAIVNTDASQTKTLAINGLTTQTLPAGQNVVVFNNLGAWQSYYPVSSPSSGVSLLNSVNRLTSNVGVSRTTTLATSGLLAALTPGNYTFHAFLPCDGTGGGGCKWAFSGTGGLTTSSVRVEGWARVSLGFSSYIQATTLPSAVLTNPNASQGTADYSGTIVVTGSGNLNVQFAQDISNNNNSILLACSELIVYTSN